MSRVANQPVELPKGVELNIAGGQITAKGSNGTLTQRAHPDVEINQDGGTLTFKAANSSKESRALAGTYRALVANMVQGVSQGFEKRLTLVGVGYRAQVQGQKLNLSLGFSHPVVHDLPQGVSAKMEGQTEIIIQGADKQRVGQVAAEVRAYRPPEPYKGKGVRYNDEHVVMKEAKKK